MSITPGITVQNTYSLEEIKNNIQTYEEISRRGNVFANISKEIRMFYGDGSSANASKKSSVQYSTSGVNASSIECIADKSLYVDVSYPNDLPANISSNRYDLISKIGSRLIWNDLFMSGSFFDHSNVDYSFLSVNGYCKIPNGYHGSDAGVVRAIKVSDSHCLVHKSVIQYYIDNGVEFLSKKNAKVFRRIKSFAPLRDLVGKKHINTSSPNAARVMSLLTDMFICEIDSIKREDMVASISFLEDIDSFKGSGKESSFIYVNRGFDSGLIRPEWNEVTGGFYELQNKNSLSNSISSGAYSSDYIVSFIPSDNLGMLFGIFESKLYLVGVCEYADIESHNGTVQYENRFFPDGKNSVGEYSQSLIDSGNFCRIKNIKYKFGAEAVKIVDDVIGLLSDSVESASILYLNSPAKEQVVSSAIPFYGVYHSYFVGESLSGIVDSRFSIEKKSSSYISGSAFLDRNTKPIVQYVNQSGNINSSIGHAYRPSYAYLNKQNKSFAFPFNGIVDGIILKENLTTKIQISNDRYYPAFKLDLAVNASQYSSSMRQVKNMDYLNGVLSSDDYLMLFQNDRLHYMRPDGSVSNVCRHDDAAVLYYLASSMLSFINNNSYSQRVLNSYSIVIDGAHNNMINAFYLTYLANNIGAKSVGIKDAVNGDILIDPQDIHIFNYEIKRLINSIRSFSNNDSNHIYLDLVSLINEICHNNKIGSCAEFKSLLVDSALFVSQFAFYIHGMGDIDVDIFALLRNKNGKIDLASLLGEANPDINNIDIYNTGCDKSSSLNSNSLSFNGSLPIWSKYNSSYGSGSRLYYDENNYSIDYTYINRYMDISVQRWLINIGDISSYVDGYIMVASDDSSYVLESEVVARNFVLMDCLRTFVAENGYALTVGASLSPFSYTPFRSKDSIYVYSNYLNNSDRIISNLIRPCLVAGCNMFLQRENVDMFIDNQFSVLDSFEKQKDAKLKIKVRNALCFMSSVYNTDVPPAIDLFSKYESGLFDFQGIRFDASKFNLNSNFKQTGSNIGIDDYKNMIMPFGLEIVDSDVELDIFNIRSEIYHTAQDLVSKNMEEVLMFINENYNAIYSVPEKRQETFSVVDQYVKPEVHGIVFGHNSFKNTSFDIGYFVRDLYINNNYIISPAGVGSWKNIKKLGNDFYKKHIFNSNALSSNNFISNVQILSSGDWGYYLNNNRMYKNINVLGGEGSSSIVNGVSMRWPKYSQIQG